MIVYLLQAFSGPAAAFMYALLAVLALAIAVVVERVYTLLRCRVDPATVLARLPAAPTGPTPVERVVAAGLPYADAERAWDAMQAAAVEQEQRVRRRVAWLGTIASISTMIGLSGTVYGLILAFGAIGDVAAAERAARLSEGSSTAMATTAFGLLVAIPSMAAHALLDGMAREILAGVEVAAMRARLWRASQ